MLDAKMLELNDTISAAVEEQERAKREEREAQIAEKLHLASIEKSNQKKAMENTASNKKRA